jgi:hypothetical protein
VISSTQNTANQAYNFQYIYSRAGSLINETYPSGRMISTSYDGANRPVMVVGPGPDPMFVSGATYAAHGAVQSMTLGNGAVETTNFNNRLQMTSKTVVKGVVDHLKT